MAIDNTIRRQKPLPRSQREKFNGKLRFSGIPPKDNRAAQIKRSDDVVRNVHIGLQEIDQAIIYFFTKVIKPRVIEDGKIMNVPVMYGSPELWAHKKMYGYTRDEKNKIISPVVMYRRTNMSRDDSIPVDKANRNLVHTFPKRYSTEHNKYDRFSLVNNIKPTYELYNVVVPDYIILSYECSIWTSYLEHMNKIVEIINYWEGSYWGDEDRFKFKTKIDSFSQNIDITTDKGRLVRSDFTLEIRGFLIPEVANDQITTQKEYTKQQIILENETEVDIFASNMASDPFSKKIIVSSNKQPAVSANQTISDIVNERFNILLAGLQYNRKLSVYSSYTAPGATIVTQNGNSIVTYPNVYTASVPANVNLDATNENDFLVFVNGQYMEHDAFAIQQSGSSFVITASTGSLGYEIENNFEVVTWGKFE